MKAKDFNDLIEKRFNKKELKEIDRKVKLEIEYIESFQKALKDKEKQS